MGRMCVAFRLGEETECMFKQIALSGSEPGTTDNHPFNEPTTNGGVDSCVVIFHLGPLVANFFVLTRDGSLRSSHYRAKGIDFTEIPNESARSAFESSMAFWMKSLPDLKAMLETCRDAKGELEPAVRSSTSPAASCGSDYHCRGEVGVCPRD